MSTDVKSSNLPVSRKLLGLQVAIFGWNAALAHAEELALSKSQPATIAFADKGKIAASLLGFGRRDLTKRLLLPSGGAFLRLLLKLVCRKQPIEAMFSPARFISSLLTYFAEPRRIGVICNDESRLKALCVHFSRHAPWHEFVAIAPDANLSGRLDLVIVYAADKAATRRIEQRLEGADIGLVIMAGRGLSMLARPNPASVRTQPAIPGPSFA
ncbi:hypothetical protein [Aliirhizobium smilacinae]|uniref:Uncharacterized protein n=1 Tax=Aliirhizobium smilacinae TaxID=1395944 RepID=A0A5C4XTY5_9HYPH|nr:hypothetical protein [Rhizobium smilacinae]TNM66060.1 hypothetical protein FHP24_07535 [Rhizobium smilacinae]